MKRFILLISLLTLLGACKEIFDPPPFSMVQANIFNSSTGIQVAPLVSVNVLDFRPYLYKDSLVNSLYLPLSAIDSSIFLVSFDGIADTIIFKHQTILNYASMESGFYYTYHINSIKHTNHRIDSISISDSTVTDTWNENIKVNIRPLSAGNN
jgi:hypothetical protein